MKTNRINSFVHDITTPIYGERYSTILYYILPEFVTAFVIFAMPMIVDMICVGQLKCTPAYAALGVANTLLHMLIKISESISVGTVILTGKCNGTRNFQDVGVAVKNAFWVSLVLGGLCGALLFIGAPFIYAWYRVADDVTMYGISFLRVRALSIICMFVHFALIGFLRGIKNTRIPMVISIIGAGLFVIADCALILGTKFTPGFGLIGSAYASLIQYGIMTLLTLFYVVFEPSHRQYAVQLFHFTGTGKFLKELCMLTIPVALDKGVFALSYIFLCQAISPMGTHMVATFEIIKNLERFAFLPAIACAQVITFLVSNDYGAAHWQSIMVNIKRVLITAALMIVLILSGICMFFPIIMQWLNPAGDVADLVIRIFPILSVLVFFDLLQLILSGALRGASNVTTVMAVRIIVFFCYFLPASTVISWLDLQPVLKFLLIYGSFYMGNALMSIAYIYRFSGQQWKEYSLKG